MTKNTSGTNEKRKSQELQPLTDEEVKEKMKYFVNLISELEWRRIIFDKRGEDEKTRDLRDTRNIIKNISDTYRKKEQLVSKDSQMFESRRAGAARLLILQEKDKHVTDVVLAVHRRLGRVDHAAHKKAYRRILYALIVQGLCRLLEGEVILIFRKSDVKLGKSVINSARKKYKEITGMDTRMTVSTVTFLPVESCGGVDICSTGGRHMVNNSLAVRLDQLLHKACPMMRIALYGLNKNRLFFDLSKMSGSPTLFDFPSSTDVSKDSSSDEENSDTESMLDQSITGNVSLIDKSSSKYRTSAWF